jgi:hypothetical protein
MGPRMRREAEARCPSVNEAHFMVHEVMLAAMAGPAAACGRAAGAGVLARLDGMLTEYETARAGALRNAHDFARID